MFKIKLVSWLLFFLALENTINTRTETLTVENTFTSEHIVPLALLWLSVIQLVMVYRYAKKKKAGRLIRGAGDDSMSMPRTSPKGEE